MRNPGAFAALSQDGMIAVEWEPADAVDPLDHWLVWEGDHPGWLGPKPYRWRDDLMQRAALVYAEYDTSKSAEHVLREHIEAHNRHPWNTRKFIL